MTTRLADKHANHMCCHGSQVLHILVKLTSAQVFVRDLWLAICCFVMLTFICDDCFA